MEKAPLADRTKAKGKWISRMHIRAHTHPLSMNHLIQPGCIFAAYNPPGKTKGRTFGFDKMTENQNNNARFKANMRM